MILEAEALFAQIPEKLDPPFRMHRCIGNEEPRLRRCAPDNGWYSIGRSEAQLFDSMIADALRQLNIGFFHERDLLPPSHGANRRRALAGGATHHNPRPRNFAGDDPGNNFKERIPCIHTEPDFAKREIAADVIFTPKMEMIVCN